MPSIEESSSIYELFGSEKEIEEDGAWIPLYPVKFADGTSPEFRIKRIGGLNCPYIKERERLLAPHRKQLRKMRGNEGEVSNELQSWAAKEAFVSKALVNWRNMPRNLKAKDTQGDLLEYTTSNAKALMDDMPEMCIWLIDEATELKYYQDEDREDDAKNS